MKSQYLVFLILALAIGCGSNSEKTKATSDLPVVSAASHTLTWSSREKDVNKVGGGFKVYVSQTSGFATSSVTPTDLPYVSGATAPSSMTFTNVTPGTYYVKIIAYSATNLPAQSGGTTSTAAEFAYIAK